jgi:hypothetical protein
MLFKGMRRIYIRVREYDSVFVIGRGNSDGLKLLHASEMRFAQAKRDYEADPQNRLFILRHKAAMRALEMCRELVRVDEAMRHDPAERARNRAAVLAYDRGSKNRHLLASRPPRE